MVNDEMSGTVMEVVGKKGDEDVKLKLSGVSTYVLHQFKIGQRSHWHTIVVGYNVQFTSRTVASNR